jgi:pSer/pThr/pTyr-binding forkhead associated (FHA) protein
MASSETSLVSVETDARGRPHKLVVSAAALRCVRGRQRGERFVLEKLPVVIGSHRSCDLRLEDPTVSSRHAWEAATGSASANGTSSRFTSPRG